MRLVHEVATIRNLPFELLGQTNDRLLVVKCPVDPVGDPPLEAANSFLLGLSLRDLSSVIAARLSVVRDLGERNEVDYPLELTIAAAIESVPVDSSGASRNRGGAVGHGKLSLGSIND